MLALADDAALARLVIAATQRPARLPPRAFRSRGRGHARAASNGPRTPDILEAPTKHRRRYSMPEPRRRRHGPQPDRRRALEPAGRVSRRLHREALMIAHGFTSSLVGPVHAGLANAQAERVVAGGRTIVVARVRIAEPGRQALAECAS